MSTPASAERWITFRLQQEQYAQRIADVKEVIDYQPPAPVPGAPGMVEGVLNVRGEVITVLSGHRLLDAQFEAESGREGRRILILDAERERIGVVVDAVEAIVSLPGEAIESVAPALDQTLLLGTARHGERLLILVDLPACCREPGPG